VEGSLCCMKCWSLRDGSDDQKSAPVCHIMIQYLNFRHKYPKQLLDGLGDLPLAYSTVAAILSGGSGYRNISHVRKLPTPDSVNALLSSAANNRCMQVEAALNR